LRIEFMYTTIKNKYLCYFDFIDFKHELLPHRF
jgi:hypothetical protein